MKPVRIVLLTSMLATLACSLAGSTEEATQVVVTEPAQAVFATPDSALPEATLAPEALEAPADMSGSSELEAETRALVQSMIDEGYILSTSGSFAEIPDFEETWAQLNWYQWWYTDYAPKDFMITAHTEWESASETADWWNAGCGFVFRERGEGDHFLAYLGMDGIVYLAKVINGDYNDQGSRRYGKVGTPEGEADVAMIVEGNQFHYFVNGERVLSRNDLQDVEGNLGLTLLSGTNKTYGTRCKMEDIALWVIE